MTTGRVLPLSLLEQGYQVCDSIAVHFGEHWYWWTIGICAAIDLLRQDKTSKFILIEKGNQIGGTWNDNQVYITASTQFSSNWHPNSILVVAVMSGVTYIRFHLNRIRSGPENIQARKKSINIWKKSVTNGDYTATSASTPKSKRPAGRRTVRNGSRLWK